MLSKTIGIFTVLILFLIPDIVDAHPHNQRSPAPVVTVTIGWTWVSPTVLRTGHWNHPHYGRSFRTLQAGPPPQRPQANAVWIPGHWERRHRKRVWVPGHWRR